MKYSDIKKKYGIGTSNSTESNTNTKNDSKRKSTYAEISAKYGLKADIDNAYITTFISDANKFFSTAEDDYNKVGWSNASDSYNSRNTTYSDLRKRSSTIRRWLTINKNKLDKATYTNLREAIDNIDTGAFSVIKTFKSANDFYSQFETEEAANKYKAREEEIQAILRAEDFEANKGYTSTKADNWWDKTWSQYDLGYNDLTYEYINNQNGIRDEIKLKHRIYSMDNMFAEAESDYEQKGYDFLKDNELSVYNYLYNTQGKEKAQEFLDSLETELVQRKAGKEFEVVKGHTLAEIFYGVVTGLDQFRQGIENLGSMVTGDEGFTSSTQYLSGMIREDLVDDGFEILGSSVGQVAYDLVNTTSNMLPSILVGTVTGGLGGALTLGASAVGNAYTEMRHLGYDEWQSRGYAALVGASETALQYALGGIGKLGGKVSGKSITKLVSGLDNAFAKVAATLGISMVSEGLEEAIQTVIEPAFKALATGEDYEAAEWSEILYSGLLGALSALGLEGAPTIAGTAITNINAKNKYADPRAQQNLIVEAVNLGGEAGAFADRYLDKLAKGKSLSGQELSNLEAATYEGLTKQDISKIEAFAKKKLKEYGETGDVSQIAKVIAKVRSGEKLTSAEQKILINSKYGRRVSNELNPDYIRAGTHTSEGVEDIGTRVINPDVYNKKNFTTEEQVNALRAAIEAASMPNSPEDENATERKYEVSESGNTIYNNTDVNVERIVSAEGGEIKVELDNGETVNASDLSFGSSAEADIYEMIARMEVTSATANEILDAFKTTDSKVALEYMTYVPLAYKFGQINYRDGLKYIKLTEDQKRRVFNRGRIDAMTTASVTDASRASSTTPGNSRRTESAKSGIIYENGVTYDEATANDLQKASMAAIEAINAISNLEVHIFESKVENGERVYYLNGVRKIAPNGFFRDGNKIYIDLNAGNNGEGAMLYTMAHEVTHYIRKWNAKGFKELGDFLIEQYGKKGVRVDGLIDEQKKKIKARYKREGKTLPSDAKLYDMAYEEMVSDAMSDMFADNKAYEKLIKLKQKNKSLWKKLGEAIKHFLDKIKAVIGLYSKENTPVALEAHYVRGFAPEVFDKLQDLYLKAFVEADNNYSTAEKTLAESGIAVNPDTESASLLSVRDVLSEDQRQNVSKALATRFGVTQEEALEWLTAETSLASLILNPKYSQYLDYTPDPNEVAIKQNSDYPQGTVDFSPICAKRREFTSVMNNILRIFPNHVFEATDLAKIRSIMQEEGMTIPCGICYVEDRRQLDTIVAQNFIDSLKLYREGSKTRPDGKAFNANQLKGLSLIDGDSYTPSIYELVSLKGLNVLKEKNPNMAEAWIKFNNARGMQSVRLLANESEYKRQILKYNKQTVKSKNDRGGLRVYSFSDAEMFHLIDIIQVITDSATVGLSLQGYTKVNEYARAVKDTGEKLNRSLIPKGELGYHIENGEVVLDYDTVEGIDINHPDFFDNKDNPNVGNITIGVSDVQIRAAMVSDFVDQIIPFHTGQSEEVLGEKGIATWSNYKDFQTEKDIATGKVSDHQINIYTEVLQVLEKEGKPITKRTFVEKFLQVCKDNGLTPRFSQFLNTNENGEYVYTEGYHKMLVDFKTFAQTKVGEYLPQMPVKPIFDNEYITKILKDYVKSQKVKDAELAKSMPKVIERITNEIVKPSDTLFSDRDSSYEDYSKPITATDVEILRSIGRKSINQFSSEDIKKAQKWAYKFYQELGIKSPFFRAWFGDWRAHQTKDYVHTVEEGVNTKYTAGRAHNIDTDSTISWGHDLKSETINHLVGEKVSQYAVYDIQAIIENAVYLDTQISMPTSKTKMPNTAFMHSFYSLYKTKDGSTHLLKIFVEEALSNNQKEIFKRGYQLKDIKKVADISNSVHSQKGGLTEDTSTTGYSISDLYEFVKMFDKDFVAAPEVSKLMVDRNGNPRVFYHGTKSEFTIFDKSKLDDPFGFYFTEDKREARDYGEPHEYYLSVRNPIDIYSDEYYDKYQGIKNTDERVEALKADGYDGINSYSHGTQWIIAFEPTQIKSATDNIGTFNEAEEDIRHSDRDSNVISNRTLLANALETTVQNDIERNKLGLYKQKIALIEAEQAKLDANRAEAETLRFKKGRTPDETKRLRELDAEATQLKNRITTYDKQLLSLEATTALKNVLEREKEMVRKRTEQKGKEALKRQKERAAETQRELLTRYQESRHKAVEGRNKTAMRHKIKNVVSDLNKLLLSPTKEQHVPIGLQKVVADALDAINMDTMNAEERVAYYNALIAKSTNPDEIAMLTKKRDFFEYRDANFKDRITALKNAYAEFKDSDDPLIRNAHNEAIENLIKNVVDAVGNSSLKDMSLAQLEAVYDMYKAVLATVRNSNKMFREGRQATVSENSEAVKAEVREVGGHKDRINKLMKTLEKFGWNMLKPITAMKAIGSNTFENLFANVRAGEDTWAVDVNEAKVFYEDKVSKYKFDKWDFKKRYTFKDSAGNEFSLSLEQIMSLYAYSKREQADQHLEVGGFVFDDAIEVVEKNKLGIPIKYEVNDATPYRLRKADLATITETLTPEQKGFVDEMQTYLSEVMGEKGNEVSLAMYDIKLYKEKNYFPLKTSRYFREFDPEKTATPKIRNAGFSKKTVPNAGNPIVLSNFMDVWANHVNDMSMYHAFVLPLEDFMRVYNYSSTAGGYDSVQQYIKNAYGAEANQYIERLMDDLNGGARVDSSAGFINKGLSLFKKSAVFASASVVVQQPSAIARAFAYINPKYFVKATPSALNLVRHKDLWAEVKKYAPVAVIKEMGYFDTGMGRSTVEWLKGNRTLGAKIDDILSKAPAIADELTWTHIWEAVKREVKDTTNLKEGSEEFLKRCGERFTEVIINTQVYDSVLSRSGMMRSKDTGMKMATAFMAEPTTTVNMMVDGIIQGKRGNKKFLAATVGAVSASIILNSILVALVYAARDDDEDETYTEKYVGSLTSELIDGFNPLTYIPFVKDFWSIAQGYDVERSDMSVVSSLWETIEGLFNEDKSGWEKVSDTTGAVSSLFGLPLKNIIRDAKGMFNLTQTVLSDTSTTKAGIGDSVEDAFKNSIPLWGRLSESETKSDKLYKAILSGDRNQINRIKGQFTSDESIKSAMRQGLRDHDSRIHEAAQARYDGNISEYTRIAKQIISEGNFSQDIVVGAINAEITAIRNSESTEDSQSEDKDEATSIYKAQDISIAFDNGDTALAKKIIEDLVNTKVANGKDEKEAKSSLRSSMTSYWKPLYKQAYSRGDASEMARIRQILYSSGLYGTANDVVKTAQNWLKD